MTSYLATVTLDVIGQYGNTQVVHFAIEIKAYSINDAELVARAMFPAASNLWVQYV